MDRNNTDPAVAAQNTQSNPNSRSTGNIKEAVCIDAARVYDSCSSKEYLEDMRVFFTPDKHDLIEHACNVRIRSAEVIKVFLHLEPVPFNQGFYAVDLNFFFDVCLDVFLPQSACPNVLHGVCLANKRVILFGSDGNVKTFESGCSADPDVEVTTGKVLPKAVCRVSEPIGLSAKICDRPPQGCDVCSGIPESISALYGAEFDFGCSHAIYATIGLFTITQLVRDIPMLIPSYEFCIPEQECQPTSDSPREMFRRIEFPAEDFFPPKVSDISSDKGKSGENA
ncbi:MULTISPECIES: hypothetical protein [Acutalibacteraceae]|uniref:hypothetical protein n=1 Tax=Acutalibacteraceae TaxID=3082771 RepID=UPI001FAAF522|nr:MULTISPECIES: hypothetical protein [Acutalibacteraceae]